MEKDMFLDREAAKQQLVEVEAQRMSLESEIDGYREAMKAAREHLKKLRDKIDELTNLARQED
jgi:hypothetical protein